MVFKLFVTRSLVVEIRVSNRDVTAMAPRARLVHDCRDVIEASHEAEVGFHALAETHASVLRTRDEEHVFVVAASLEYFMLAELTVDLCKKKWI